MKQIIKVQLCMFIYITFKLCLRFLFFSIESLTICWGLKKDNF